MTDEEMLDVWQEFRNKVTEAAAEMGLDGFIVTGYWVEKLDSHPDATEGTPLNAIHMKTATLSTADIPPEIRSLLCRQVALRLLNGDGDRTRDRGMDA